MPPGVSLRMSNIVACVWNDFRHRRPAVSHLDLPSCVGHRQFACGLPCGQQSQGAVVPMPVLLGSSEAYSSLSARIIFRQNLNMCRETEPNMQDRKLEDKGKQITVCDGFYPCNVSYSTWPSHILRSSIANTPECRMPAIPSAIEIPEAGGAMV